MIKFFILLLSLFFLLINFPLNFSIIHFSLFLFFNISWLSFIDRINFLIHRFEIKIMINGFIESLFFPIRLSNHRKISNYFPLLKRKSIEVDLIFFSQIINWLVLIYISVIKFGAILSMYWVIHYISFVFKSFSEFILPFLFLIWINKSFGTTHKSSTFWSFYFLRDLIIHS